MLTSEELETISDFLLDGAKILFGSLVVGVFVPSTFGSVPWLTLISGVIVTLIFLAAAAKLATIAKIKT